MKPHFITVGSGSMRNSGSRGAGRVRLDRPYGHDVQLDAYRLDPDRVAELLADVGVRVVARTVREPESWERTPQAYLLGQRVG